jgi:hypothetical protein
MLGNTNAGLKIFGGVIILSLTILGINKLLKPKKIKEIPSENLKPQIGNVIENDDIDFINE